MNTNYNSPTTMVVNLNNFKHNIREIQKYVGNDITIMPIIKANAYGTYLNTQLDILNMFEIVGISSVSEGIFLRKVGFKKEIFVLNQPSIDEIDDIIKYNLTIGISLLGFVDALKNINKKIKVHIEIGTGMGRTGINPNRSKEFTLELLKNKNIIIEGVYTHLSSADTDFAYTKKQLESFDKAIAIIKNEVNTIKYIHANASNGIINFQNKKYNLVRPGLIMYGYPSAKDTYQKINIKPICTLQSKITYLKWVPKGTSIGYGRTFITKRKSLIATIPIGYADGLKRCLSNNFKVFINDRYAKIIGNICMDSFMVDVTHIKDIKINDMVYIFDNKHITLEEIAKRCNTINYEILTSISARVPRIFKKD